MPHTVAVKFRLYPTPAQETVLRQTLDTCRDVYNSLVNWRKNDYEINGAAPSYYDQKKALPVWKKAHPELCGVHSQVLQDVCKRVDLAFLAFFRRIKLGETPGYPRTKGAGYYDSLTYTQSGGYSVGEKSISFSKLGIIKAVIHRALPGVPKTCTVRRQSGKWFATITCKADVDVLPETSNTIGIDVGLNHFAITSDAEFIDNPRFFRQGEKALAKASRKFDRVKNKHRSPERRKAKRVLARKHERIRNQRHNFVHQLARDLVNRFGVIGVENLNVDNMVLTPKPKPDADNPGNFLPNGASRKAGLNKSIADAAWSMFRTILTHKAESAGRLVVGVPPAYTSQDCSGCGTRVPKALKERWHSCPNPDCLLSLHRDVNAAKNILNIALSNSVGLHRLAA